MTSGRWSGHGLRRTVSWLATALMAAFVLAVLFWKHDRPQPDPTLAGRAPAENSLRGRRVMPVSPPPAAPVAEQEPATLPEAARLPAWQRYAALSPDRAAGWPRIVLVLDDLGLSRSDTRRIARMRGPLTLAFLPYANGLQGQADMMRAAGHELLVHMPMAAENGAKNPGPMALMDGLDHAEFQQRLAWNLDRFTGFVGVNNHMGSRLTAQPEAMLLVMEELRRRGLLFLDSRTTPHTVAARMAARAGLPVASRDVFIDNEPDRAAVAQQLAHLEDIARREGLAIGIGHPHDGTLAALEAWLKGLDLRGIALVPLSAAVTLPDQRQAAVR